jgi:two-component system sensor histidine kinase KdpD
MEADILGSNRRGFPWAASWPAWLCWAAGWATMLGLDGTVDLANLAMVLLLSSALASLWLPGWASATASAAAVAAFNWTFVPPRHTFTVDLQQHALLLATMLVVNWIISGLVIRQRRLAEAAMRHAEREARLRAWGDTLRDAPDPPAHASALHDALASASGVPVALTILTRLGGAPERESVLRVGDADPDQRAGLALCIRDGRPLGPGTGHYEEQPDWYLPLRGRGATVGAAVLRGLGEAQDRTDLRPHLQALCDQMGGALLRALADREDQRIRAQTQAHGVRNALLAAISHDYRTPLATIMSAASALTEQADRLDVDQRRRLASGIVEEAERLSRLTDNTLQLARLDAPGVALRRDWESAEEIVGAVLRRSRRRPDGKRLRARLEPGLPLLWCDAMLVSQLLENLIDNALKYSPPDEPVELLVRRIGDDLVLAVRDRGPGIEPAWRERVFDVFQRGTEASRSAAVEATRSGAGIGLAVCRAIARAHGGELRLRARSHGGCSFEFALPVREQPESPQRERDA